MGDSAPFPAPEFMGPQVKKPRPLDVASYATANYERFFTSTTVFFGILQRYIYKELSKSLLLTVFILTGVFFLVASMQVVRKYSQLISFLDLITLSPYIVGKTLSFTIPIGLLSAVTLVYGRMSQDREILILRTAGIHARCMFRPAFMLAVFLLFLCLYLNLEILPYTLLKQEEIKYRALDAIVRANFSSEETTITYIPNLSIYYHKLKNGRFQKLLIQHTSEGYVTNEILADSGSLVYDQTHKTLTFYLYHGSIGQLSSGKKEKEPKIKKEERFFFDQFVFPVHLEKTADGEVNRYRAKYKRFHFLVEGSYLWYELAQGADYRARQEVVPSRIQEAKRDRNHYRRKSLSHAFELHQRIAMSRAPFIIVIVGASVGLMIQNSNRLVVFGISAIPIILVYYPMQMLGETLGYKERLSPFLASWLSNFVTGEIGRASCRERV